MDFGLRLCGTVHGTFPGVCRNGPRYGEMTLPHGTLRKQATASVSGPSFGDTGTLLRKGTEAKGVCI